MLEQQMTRKQLLIYLPNMILSLPVVDQENRLVGIVTVDDVVAVITQEATEDFN